MSVPQFNMRQLLEAGVHFGHQSHRWNPKMAPFIYGARNNIHILDLTQTVPMLHQALNKVSDTVASGGRVLFVATKRQASDSIAEAAKKSAQYFINHRWLGGTLTNWKTISTSIRRLRQLDDILADPQMILAHRCICQNNIPILSSGVLAKPRSQRINSQYKAQPSVQNGVPKLR